jgi:hypothetical protein
MRQTFARDLDARRHQRSAARSNLRIIKPGERPATDIPAAA